MSDENGGTALQTIEDAQTTEANPLSFFMTHYDDFARMAKQLATSGMFRHKSGQAVGAILLYALEMKIPVTHALRGMYHIPGGSLGMEGQLMLGLARSRCGVTVHDIKRSRESYSATLHRGDEKHPISFTIQQAAAAGLVREKPDGSFEGKDVWHKWREDMLQWRAISQGLRVIAPDFFMNVYSAEEAMSLQAANVAEHAHDASDELRDMKLNLDIALLEELLVKDEVAEGLNYDDRENIADAIEKKDADRIVEWVATLREMVR